MIPPDVKPDIKPDIPPDIKPDIKPCTKNSGRTNTEEESFVAHVARRSKQILIDDYQSAKTKGETRLIVAPDLTLPTPRRKYRTKQTKDSKSTINTTSASAEPTDETRKSEGGLTPDKVTQMVNEDSIEHRKRKHNVGTNFSFNVVIIGERDRAGIIIPASPRAANGRPLAAAASVASVGAALC